MAGDIRDIIRARMAARGGNAPADMGADDEGTESAADASGGETPEADPLDAPVHMMMQALQTGDAQAFASAFREAFEALQGGDAGGGEAPPEEAPPEE